MTAITTARTVHLIALPGGVSLPVRIAVAPLSEATDSVVVDSPARLAPLERLADYPAVLSLLDPACMTHAATRRREIAELLTGPVYIFGAHRVGAVLAGKARDAGVEITAFLDNDPVKDGSELEGLAVRLPRDLAGATVVIASGHHSNAIAGQLAGLHEVTALTLHEFLYAIDAPHCAGSFADIVDEPHRDPYRFISAFARLDDEESRRVFDGLLEMRTRLTTLPAERIKSPYADEYLDAGFVTAEAAHRFLDAGAASGDTLIRVEQRFGSVEQAWLFEPEIQPYYRALSTFADRPEVWVFNMGLDQSPSRATYQPEWTFDWIGEEETRIADDIPSFIQGVPASAVVHGPVGLFKLDIEGMEERALRGAAELIARDRPVIAACAYHRPDDFWRLMDVVLAARPDYRVGIRAYADILEDITLYFY